MYTIINIVAGIIVGEMNERCRFLCELEDVAWRKEDKGSGQRERYGGTEEREERKGLHNPVLMVMIIFIIIMVPMLEEF